MTAPVPGPPADPRPSGVDPLAGVTELLDDAAASDDLPTALAALTQVHQRLADALGPNG